jgi:UDP-N-acetylmuramyl pentapeptide phosphotransferase/UDP-N-acetylglucosamine-1-phosphate transferase
MVTPIGAGIVLVTVNVAGWIGYGLGHLALLRAAMVCSAAALAIAAVSLIDDLGHVRYLIRLAMHSLGAVAVIAVVGPWHAIALPLLDTVTLGTLAWPVTLLWMVGLINAFNFVDGLDGMAGAQAASAGLGWIVLGLVTGNSMVAGGGGVLCASCLGFLWHNWHPARIFMGDVGATFLGYTLAILPVVASRQDARLPLVGLLLVWPAVFDSGFTVTRRLLRRETVVSGHRTFLFHRLADAGWSHSDAAVLYGALPLMGGALAFTWVRGNRGLHSAVGLAAILLCLVLWLTVRHAERHQQATRGAASGVLEESGALDI